MGEADAGVRRSAAAARRACLLVASLPALVSAALLGRVPDEVVAEWGPGAGAGSRLWRGAVAALVAGALIAAWRARRSPALPPRAWAGAVLLAVAASGPWALFTAMFVAAPRPLPGPWLLGAVGSLLAPGLLVVGALLPRAWAARLDPRRAVLVAASALSALAAVELALAAGGVPLSDGKPSVNAPDRSYWHFAPDTVLLIEGLEHEINRWGFRGPADVPPAPSGGPRPLRVLVVGDSVPYGGTLPLPATFPVIAGARLAARRPELPPVLVMNAAIPSFSVEQIEAYYTRGLQGLDHDLVVFCFYLDDVNREPRYKRRDTLYTPAWPEWIQDLYYRSHLGQRILRRAWISPGTFLLTRRRGEEQAWPDALAALERARITAEARGARFAVLDVPRFTWPRALPSADAYPDLRRARQLAAWCEERGVPHGSLLDALVGRDPDGFRISLQDVHFTEAGHALVADALADLLERALHR